MLRSRISVPAAAAQLQLSHDFPKLQLVLKHTACNTRTHTQPIGASGTSLPTWAALCHPSSVSGGCLRSRWGTLPAPIVRCSCLQGSCANASRGSCANALRRKPPNHKASPQQPPNTPSPPVGYAAANFGWQWGMWAPGAFGLIMGVAVLFALKDSPEELGE